MYGKQFFDRLSWQQVCEFLRYGCEGNTEEGSLKERDRHHERAFFAALEQYWRDIRATDWTTFPGIKADLQAEKLSQPIVDELVYLETIAFQAGFLAGLQMGREPIG